MNLPGLIALGGQTYKVVRSPANDDDGQFDARRQEIAVRFGLPLGYERVILVHELVHAMWEHAGFTAEGRAAPTEEEVAAALSYQLLDLLRGNPALVDYLVSR